MIARRLLPASPSSRGVVARIVTGPHDAHRQDPHRPMRYDTGRPRAVIRFRISQPRTASLPCPAGLRARRPATWPRVPRSRTGPSVWSGRDSRRTGGRCPAPARPPLRGGVQGALWTLGAAPVWPRTATGPFASCDAPPRKGGPPVRQPRRLDTRASAGTYRRRGLQPGRVAVGSSHDVRSAGST